MIPSFIGPAPVSPVSSSAHHDHDRHHQYHDHHGAAVRVVVWALGDNNAVPAFLGVDMHADAASCSSISDCGEDNASSIMMEQDDADLGNDRELECLISFDDDGDSDMDDYDNLVNNTNHDVTAAIFTPYPFDRQTKEEIENFRQLGLSFGEDWSLQLADEVTCSEHMSILDVPTEEVVANPPPTQVPPQTTMNGSTAATTSLGLDESDEVKAMRNQLWKQSLKTSMFTSLQSCKR
jgi:hypothetical protein